MDEDFLAIGHAMEELVDDPVDCYWLVKNFVSQFHHKFGDSIPHLVSMPLAHSVQLVLELPQSQGGRKKVEGDEDLH